MPTTAPDIDPNALITGKLLMAGLFLIVSVMLAWVAGIFRRSDVALMPRLTDKRSAQGTAVSLLLGLGVWFGLGTVLFMVLPKPAGATQPADMLTATNVAALSLIPPLAAWMMLVTSDVHFGLPHKLGYGVESIPVGVKKGVIGFIIIMPAIFASLIVLDVVYSLIHYQHPNAHMFLNAMDDASPFTKQLIIIGATVAAPLFEETLFRGHLQSILRAIIGGTDPKRQRFAAWIAILLSATAFAFVHEAWSAPPILLLAIGLGYAYERTNNLWVPIFIHSLFNLSQTLLYLSGAAG